MRCARWMLMLALSSLPSLSELLLLWQLLLLLQWLTSSDTMSAPMI